MGLIKGLIKIALFVGFFSLILFSSAFGYTMNGSCVYEINENGKIEVCNATSKGGLGVHTQYAWITPNKTGYVNVTFEFDIQLKYGKLWRWEGGGWSDKTSQVEHLEYGGKHYYTWKNVYYETGNPELYAWKYKVPWNVSGKWDLYFWRGSYQNPNILVELDPWYNNTYQTRIAYNISNPDAFDHLYENITINFSLGAELGGWCHKNMITRGNDSTTEVEVMFDYMGNTTATCTYVFSYNVSASQDGNYTAGYMYFNATDYASDVDEIWERFGKFVIFYDDFEDGVWNSSAWVNESNPPTEIFEVNGEMQLAPAPAQDAAVFINNESFPTSDSINMSRNYTIIAKIKGKNATVANDLGMHLQNISAYNSHPVNSQVFTGWYDDGSVNKLRLYMHGIEYHRYPWISNQNWYHFSYRLNASGIMFQVVNDTQQYEVHTGNNTILELLLEFRCNNPQMAIDDVIVFNGTIIQYQNKSIISTGIYESLLWNYSLSFDNITYEFTNNKIEIDFENADASNFSNVTINYNNTEHIMTKISNSTWQINLTADFIMSNNTVMNFYFNFTENGTRFYTPTTNQNVHWGIYISDAWVSSATVLAGDTFIDYMNITLINISSATREVVVTFNNTNYTLIIIGTNGTLIEYSTTLTTPLIATENENFTLNHTLAVSYGGNTSYRQSATPIVVEVFDMVLSNCSGLITDIIINYTTYDEINHTKLNGTNYFWKGSITTATGSIRTYSFTYNNTHSAAICLYPTNTNATLNSTLEYYDEAGHYSKRTHYMDGIIVNTNNVRNIQSYLLPKLNSTNILFQVRDEFFRDVPDVIIRILAWNYTNNDWIEIESIRTDGNGEALTPLIANIQLYKFAILRNNTLVREFPQQFISSSVVTLTTAPSVPLVYNIINNIDLECDYNNNTKVAICTYTSDDPNIVKFRLFVVEDLLIGNRTFCLEESTASSGSLSCDMSTTTVSTDNFVVKFSVFRAAAGRETEYVLWTINALGVNSSIVYAGVGIWIAWILIVVLAFSFDYSPTLFMIGILLGVIFSVWMGFIHITAGLITALIALLAVAIHKVKT